MLTLVYKCLVNIEPFDLTSSSHVRISKYNLRGGGGGGGGGGGELIVPKVLQEIFKLTVAI